MKKSVKKGEREEWIDVAKGVGICLVILGHTSIPSYLSNFIWAFHMPLFFVLSGYCTKWDKYCITEFLWRRIQTYLIPFFVYSIIVAFILSCFDLLKLNRLLYNGWQGYALWFIPVLFLSSIVVKCLSDIGRLWIGGVSLIILGASLKYCHINLPWTLCTVPYASFLIIAGTMLRKHSKWPNGAMYRMGTLVISFVITLVISQFWRLDMAWNNIVPVIPKTIGAFSGVVMTSVCSVFLTSSTSFFAKGVSNLFQKIGKETFIILAFSQMLQMLMIHFTTWNTVNRYIVLILALIAIKYIKDILNKYIGYTVLR